MGELIISKAKELFFSYGLKSVSMDDLAKKTGISKKTIYLYFSDKNELVDKVVNDLIQCHQQIFEKCEEDANDAVDAVLKQANTPFDTWASINQNFFYELEKFFPGAWEKLVQHKQKTVLPTIIKNLERGIAENYYRSDIDVSFIADVRLEQISMALNPKAFTSKKTNACQAMNDLTVFYLHGITTEKGKKLLNKYLKNTNEMSHGEFHLTKKQ